MTVIGPHVKFWQIQSDKIIKNLVIRTIRFNAVYVFVDVWHICWSEFSLWSNRMSFVSCHCLLNSPHTGCCSWSLKSLTAPVGSCNIIKMSPPALVGMYVWFLYFFVYYLDIVHRFTRGKLRRHYLIWSRVNDMSNTHINGVNAKRPNETYIIKVVVQ